MQVGLVASARGRSGRHLRFMALVAALVAVNAWLWTRIVVDVVNQDALSDIRLAFAAVASLTALGLVITLWHSPLSRNVQMMATPALRQALATHHAGHIVAAHLEDPSRIRRADMSEPCNHHVSEIPAITQSSLRSEMAIALAGLTAEEVFAGEGGSHAAADLVRATDIGANMVGRYGMAGSLVSLSASRPRRNKFVGRVLDDARTRKELEALLREVKRETVRSILENRHSIIAVRDALMRRTRLDPNQLREIIAGAEKARHTDDEVLVDLRIVGNSRPAASEM